MERMMDNETFDEVLNGFKEADSIVKRLKTRIAELEEENKKLKSDYDRLDKVASENVRTLDELEAERIELEQENKKLKEEVDELDRINHNLNAKLSDLYDVKQILRDIVININRLDKLKEIVFKYDARPEE